MPEPLTQQTAGLLGSLPGRQLQPAAGLLGRRRPARSGILHLGATIACACGLTEQVMADSPITGAAAIAAKHLSQAALSHHHTLARWALEQPPSQVLDLWFVTQTRTVE